MHPMPSPPRRRPGLLVGLRPLLSVLLSVPLSILLSVLLSVPLSASLSVLVSAAALRAEDWPSWRGPGGVGISAEKGIATDWSVESVERNVLWKFEDPGLGHSSPIVWGDALFITTAVDDSRLLIRLDPRTGKEAWRREVVRASRERKHPKNSHASATPATDGERVYVSFLDPPRILAAAYDFQGELVWKTSPADFRSIHGFCTTPVLFEDTILLNCDQDDPGACIVALDRKDGSLRWKTVRPNAVRSYCPPTVFEIDGKPQMVLAGSETVCSYDPRDGKQLWMASGPTEQCVASAVWGDGLVFITGGYPDREILAIDPRGAGDVTETHVRWRADEGVAYVPSPLYVDGHFYVVSDSGALSAIEAKTGRYARTVKLGEDCSASLLYASGHIYCASEKGKVFVVRATPDLEIVRTIDMGDPIFASPVPANGVLYIRTWKRLWAIREEAPLDFDETFTGKTLRFDYFWAGTRGDSHICIDEVRLEGDWPGSRTRLVDDSGLGAHLFAVSDAATGRALYSRGFSNIFGEWETIAEAGRGVRRSLHESQRFPEPRAKSRIAISRRSAGGELEEVFSMEVDPGSRFVNRAPLAARGEVRTLFENGPPSRKVDLLILGDGYAEADIPAFHADAERLTGVLFETEPFRSRRGDFNVRAVGVASPASGITDPRQGIWIETPLGLRFNAFDLPRYVLTERNREIREIAAAAPYDALVLLGNSKRYGGGGIFGLWATCTAGSPRAPYVFVHELGHAFAGLADEYYTSQVAYEDFHLPTVEPWEPNITALLDPEELKWRHLVEPGTPIPTPWGQNAYDDVSLQSQKERAELQERGAPDESLEALSKETREKEAPILRTQSFVGKVGAFEGAGYRAKGLYRPEVDCIMFSGIGASFCRVCREAIERAIERHAE